MRDCHSLDNTHADALHAAVLRERSCFNIVNWPLVVIAFDARVHDAPND